MALTTIVYWVFDTYVYFKSFDAALFGLCVLLPDNTGAKAEIAGRFLDWQAQSSAHLFSRRV